MSLDNKISNIIGTKLPTWLLKQLDFRAKMNAQDSRDNNNLLYLANKTAWVRVVSSINLISQNDITYFNRLTGGTISNADDLAKQFVLFGGTSKYINKNSYQLRSGVGQDGAYGILGNDEIKKYGYRPMPGITSVNIETQGRLGSVRAATINFKCWDKDQLDIIDALYFKLGFTMFLEWGNTYFYKADDSTKLLSTDLYSIDPFQNNLTKEEINLQISKNTRATEGNYDAMLGIVTNFNFSLNQEGGFDCSIRLMGLGVLGDSIKINNQGVLPDILKEEIKLLTNTLVEISNAQNIETKTPEVKQPGISGEELFNKYIKYVPKQGSLPARYTGGQVSVNSLDFESIKTVDAAFNTDKYGWIYFIRRQNGFIPLRTDLLDKVKVSLDYSRLEGKLDKQVLYNKAVGIEDPRLWEFPANYLENAKDIIGKPIATVANLLNSVIDVFTVSKNGVRDSELNKANDTGVLNLSYKGVNGKDYLLKVTRKLWATSNRSDIVDSFSSISQGITYTNSAYYYIDTPTFVEQFKRVLVNPNNQFNVKEISALPNKTTTTFKINIPFTRTVKTAIPEKIVSNPDLTKTTIPATISDSQVTFSLDVEISIDDSSLIKNFIVPSDVVEPLDFGKKLTDQNQEEAVKKEEQAKDQEALYTQLEQALKTQSALELTLRTIQVHALTKAIRDRKNDLEIGRTVYPLDITNLKDTSGGRPFLNQIFSNGIFTSFINDLLDDNKIDISKYDQLNLGRLDRLKIQAKYGFATNLMAGKSPITSFSVNNFKNLLTAYVVPYQINQEIYQGVPTNHPVYIPLGLLLMLLNHSCTMYDSKNEDTTQTPMVYVDFSTEHNFCLSNTKQLSTNPWVTLIPFEGGFEGYKQIFDKNVISGDYIKSTSDSKEKIRLFNPDTQDVLSPQLPIFKDIDNIYRGRVMNILLNIDYLVKLVKDYSSKDETNSIYLKTFLEQILSDLNRFLGNINVFRLAYNDQGNTFHIVDDQVIPVKSGDQDNKASEEEMLTPSNSTSLPVYGKFSIAKNLEIKTEVSSKLSNMLAISANANVPDKATLSTNGDNFGYINTHYADRYITNRKEVDTGSIANYDTIINSSAQFNKTIYDFYSTINPSEASVGHATNYFIDRMSKIKNFEYPTRASSMIPVSVNFTTDGIAGLSMGQSFTIPDQLLPYTYNDRVVDQQEGLDKNHVNKVGFVVVGLNHTLDNNQWNTNVRANMIFLKNKTEFKGNVVRAKSTGTFEIDISNQVSNVYASVEKSTPIEKEQAIKISKTFFEQKGFKPVQVSAIIGALLQESQLNPNAVNPSSGAYGLAQWLGTRKTLLQLKPNYSQLQTQLEFIVEEFNSYESSVGNRLKNATTLEDAIAAMASYERYKGVGSNATYQDVLAAAETGNRIGYSKNIFNRYYNI